MAMMSAVERWVLSIGLALLTLLPVSASARCVGDCSGNGQVTIDELVTLVNIALGSAPASTCPNFVECQICISDLIGVINTALAGCPLPVLPALVSSVPAAGGVDTPRTEWIQLHFAGAVDRFDTWAFHLQCDGSDVAALPSVVGDDTVVLNPVADLPAGADCRATWPGQELDFAVAAGTTDAEVLYDPTDPALAVPYPDDARTVADASTITGLRLNVPVPAGPMDRQTVFNGLLPEANKLDGFSPIAHFVVELAEAPDVSTLPLTPAQSLDPLATVGLFDLTPTSPTFGARIPFRIEPRTDTSSTNVVSHTLLIFPSIPLEPTRRYGLIITRRVLVDPTRPLGPSAFFRAALDGSTPSRAADLIYEVIDAVAHHATPHIAADDVALALRISVRSNTTIPSDLLAVKEQVLAAPPADYTITDVEPQDAASPLAAIVHGTWNAPEWRTADKLFFVRDENGRPVQTGSKAVPFTLALPKAALNGPVPIAMYQHGNPGSSEAEVPSAARRALAGDGFAVIGFTDVLNRELSPGITDDQQAILAQVTPVLVSIIQNQRIPDYWVETRSEMLAFLRFFDGLGSLDVLPVGAPDGVPELDPTRPRVYLGISEGANNGQAFLAYAPEIKAGALVAGGGRLTEVLIHQAADLFINTLGPLFPSMTASDIWVALALFQTDYDVQDPHNHVRFIYRDRLPVAGTTRKPSILALEGLNDTMVPNHATDSMAWSMGPLPHIQPVQRAVPFLEVVTAPVTANIDAETTAGFYQYVPVGVPGIPVTPGCESQPEGHFCAQIAPASFHQRSVFFQGALTGVPTIIDPLAAPVPARAVDASRAAEILVK
jgi:hypothetical protein